MFPRTLHFLLLIFLFAATLSAQSNPSREGESSSKDTQIDLSPPPGDDASHPDSIQPSDDVGEMQLWDPHKAMKNVEVGDFYFKRGNYKAAEGRFREALKWKSNDAVATFKLAQALEKEQDWTQARQFYESYLKILPNGEFAQQAKEGVERAIMRGKSEAKK